SIAEFFASVLNDWETEQVATNFSHCFQPMTNITAGKHDSFLSVSPEGKVLLEFSGKALTKGEPDASSFPNGGLRATFEARGYTAWDPTSPAFVRNGTLFIPTAFCSYTGEALDKKTPLLRSMQAISKEALRIVKIFGNTTSKKVVPTVGAEQEYFLISRDTYEKRLDLKVCGRTLFGAMPPKGQELDDHYCGRIRLKVTDFMHQLDSELWSLGVTSKTKHNEAAPAQHELAPIYSSANIACDHNQLTMEVMRETAKKLGLACLLHEKPFAGVNGSGKHNNWSLTTDDGINLLDPGKTPYENAQFLMFLCAVISAVDDYADLLRCSAASASNDHRLGACEAPPAIISIFLGEQLTSVLEDIANGKTGKVADGEFLNTGVSVLASVPKDDSDRNRTSPFAFTGNKFEFRMVGSADSVAAANYVLNTIVADALKSIADRLIISNHLDQDIKDIISETMKKHGKIIFNGNNYSQEWVTEAHSRGLYNLSNMVDAAESLIATKNVKLLEKYDVLTKVECQARYEVMLENYIKVKLIEAKTMLEMSRRQIIPAVIEYAGKLATAYNQIKQAGFDNEEVKIMIGSINQLIKNAQISTADLEEKINSISVRPDGKGKAIACRDDLVPACLDLRGVCDRLEIIVSEDAWPMPNYTDLLYRV
ncbi:MAG: glutamine synthetase III, partial [Oscillospiraceae bacterium]|nr:glutamine synthetase III [Oscillospiraceae bacterium]